MDYRAPHPVLSVGSPYHAHPGVASSKLSKRPGGAGELAGAPNKGSGPFAAALRSLAKQAGPDTKEGAAEREKDGAGKDKASATPPTHAQPPAAKRASPQVLPSSGFQPYRPDDSRLTHPAAPGFPLVDPSAYSSYHASLYNSAALQYRLEEQLYLERVLPRALASYGGVPLPPYAALYPPPLTHPHHHLPPHGLVSPALHERLKLEEEHRARLAEEREKEMQLQQQRERERELREREKELALQREREREREREAREREMKEREREREQREKERMQREKERARERERESLRDERDRERMMAQMAHALPPHLLSAPPQLSLFSPHALHRQLISPAHMLPPIGLGGMLPAPLPRQPYAPPPRRSPLQSPSPYLPQQSHFPPARPLDFRPHALAVDQAPKAEPAEATATKQPTPPPPIVIPVPPQATAEAASPPAAPQQAQAERVPTPPARPPTEEAAQVANAAPAPAEDPPPDPLALKTEEAPPADVAPLPQTNARKPTIAKVTDKDYDSEYTAAFDRSNPLGSTALPRINLDIPHDKLKEDAGLNLSSVPKSTFLSTSDVTTKSVQQSPIISPSSIPIPNPSTSTNKQPDNYSMYGGYLYSIPGYSAFQPLPYPNLGLMGQNTAQTVPISLQNEPPPTTDYIQLTSSSSATSSMHDTKSVEERTNLVEIGRNTLDKHFPKSTIDLKKADTDFEAQFTPEIIPTVIESKNHDTIIQITSLSQSSGSTISFPKNEQPCLPESKKKIPERFSLKTSIPISKIDMKCVNNPPDAAYQMSQIMTKMEPNVSTGLPINFQNPPETQKIAIHSNIVIKSGVKIPPPPAPISEVVVPPPDPPVTTSVASTNMATLINAAESLSKGEMLWPSEQKEDSGLTISRKVEPVSISTTTSVATLNACITTPLQIPIDKSKLQYPNMNADPHTDSKNQLVYIPNTGNNNSKLMLTISQQQTNSNPILLQKNVSSEPKNLQAPSRLLSQNKKSKDSLLLAESSLAAHKVVALKRLHQDNGDENDFENLITENQIYGNKIVVKEKSHGTLQEQDIRMTNLSKQEIAESQEPKNVFLQPNFLYLSNVQFPNVMMIKNGTKVSHIPDPLKQEKVAIEIGTTINSEKLYNTVRHVKGTQSVQINKDKHVLKPNNNILHTISNKQIAKAPELLLQSGNQKVIVNPQIVYQVPMLVEENLTNLQKSCNNGFIGQNFASYVNTQTGNKGYSPTFCEQQTTNTKNDKLFIACPYQVDAKLSPKIVITNLRATTPKSDVVSSIDLAEKRRKMRRLKYLANRDRKDLLKAKTPIKTIVTPTEIKTEIQKEFMKTQMYYDDQSSDSQSDCDVRDLAEYEQIIEKYGKKIECCEIKKVDFFKAVGLTTKEDHKEKETELLEKRLRIDSIASACISVGRLDCIGHPLQRLRESTQRNEVSFSFGVTAETKLLHDREDCHENMAHKFVFLAHLELGAVSPHYKDGYEKVWQEIIKDRKKRNGESPFIKYCEESYAKQQHRKDTLLNTTGQLKIMTEIKKTVTENNSLIKRRIDGQCAAENSSNEGIQILAEKSCTELDKLSRMADRSVKMFSGKDCAKTQNHFRPIPTIDSSKNTQIPNQIPQIPKISIPSMAKIISLKSIQDPSIVNTSPAISMDEPQNSAAGVKTEIPIGTALDTKETVVYTPVGQTFGEVKNEPQLLEWPGLEAIHQSYQRYNAACKSEIASLLKETSRIKLEMLSRRRDIAASNEAVRRLLADKHSLAAQEIEIKNSVDRIMACINIVKRYQ